MATIDGKTYVTLMTTNGLDVIVDQGEQGHTTNVWVRPGPNDLKNKALYIVNAQDMSSAAAFTNGSEVRIRGTDYDPWLRMPNGSNGPIEALRDDPSDYLAGSIFVLTGIEAGHNLTPGDAFKIREKNSQLWLQIQGPRLLGVPAEVDGSPFVFEDANIPVPPPLHDPQWYCCIGGL